jgi:antitoxin ChpS
MLCYTFVKHTEAIMSKTSLRRSGGSLILTIPAAFVAQNKLDAGSEISWRIEGGTLLVSPVRSKLTLQDLLAATPPDSVIEDWERMKPVGAEFGAEPEYDKQPTTKARKQPHGPQNS